MPDHVTVEAYLAKAEESLATAENAYANHQFNSCTNRCYYACYQAAIAALLRAEIGPRGERGQWGHEYVHAAFEGVLIERRKLYPSSLRDVLPKGHELRLVADWSPVGHAKASRSHASSRSSICAGCQATGR